MIPEKCFTSEWLQKKALVIKADPGLLGKAVHSFALLGHLADSGLDFVFKGGTSLLLHVPVARRLSIDIDILCGVPAAQLDRVLALIATNPPFLRYEEDKRGERGLPNRRHFKFFYPRTAAGDSVLLDVVEEKNIPHDVITKPISTLLLEIEREVIVRLPNVESLLADKLTAFAPYTVGVLLNPSNGKPDSLQIMKQLFDIGELFSIAKDLSQVRRVYSRVFALENGYRKNRFHESEALQDTLQMAQRFCHHRLKGVSAQADVMSLEDGIKRMNSHLINHQFDINAAKIAAAKAGLLSQLFLSQNKNQSLTMLQNIPNQKVFQSLSITGEWEKLNRLKQANPEAFHYWHQASLLKDESKN